MGLQITAEFRIDVTSTGHGDEVVLIPAADEGAQIVERFLIGVLALECPASHDRHPERQIGATL